MTEPTSEVDDYVEEDLEPVCPLEDEDLALLPDVEAMLREVNVDE